MSKHKSFKTLTSMLLAACFTASIVAVNVSAVEAYDPYSYDRWGDPVSSQAGYVADKFVDGISMGCGSFNEPADMYISYDNLMYIADKGNNRIVIADIQLNYIKEMKEFNHNGETLTLNKPLGVYVDQYTGFIYICDSENDRVLKCDTDGNVDKIFTRPINEIYSADVTFNPNKVCVDKAGNVYIVVKSVTKGAVMYDKEGEFLGFFGANTVQQTAEVLSNAFWNLFKTDDQKARSKKTTPVGFTNFDIDDDGFIYTVTDSQTTTQDLLKKLNPRGDNIIDSLGIGSEFTFGDRPPTYYSIYAKQSSLTDIDIGPNGELNILDFEHGRIFQYDKECWLLFIMGGIGEQLGTFRSATAIESYDDKLFVLDSRKNNITIFTRTVFGEIVTDAANLYNDGYYVESLVPWQNVLKYDGNYRRAYMGIGNALYNQYKYEEAMEYFKIGKAQYRYGRAFEGYRDQWLKENFTAILVVLALIIVAVFVIKWLFKKEILRLPRFFRLRRKGNN